MISRCNKHIKKFNQLVDVHGPDGIAPLETVQSRETDVLEARKEAIGDLREDVRRLSTSDFFEASRRAEMSASDTLPAPEEAAASHRRDLLDRLDEIESALADALSGTEVLDTSDDLEL